MSGIAFTPWPPALADRYRERGCWIDRPLTDILRQQAKARPHAIAVICGARAMTYAQLDAMSDRLAAHLQRCGLRPFDTALVQLPNVAEFYAVFFALLKLGVAPVNALFSHQKFELVAYASQIRPHVLIGAAAHPAFRDGKFAAELQAIAPAWTQVLLLGESAWADSLDAIFSDESFAHEFVARPTPADNVAFFQLSGGSTGAPKLIPRTHNDYYYSVRRSAEICALTSATRYLCALPAAHNFPLSSPGALGVFHAGGTVVLAANPEPLACFALIEKHRVNMTALVPPAVALWLQAAPHHRAQLQSLQLLQVGGASFAEALARRVPAELGCALQQVFGMAEGLVNYTRLDDDDQHVFTTQGRPMSVDDEVRVVDRDGNAVPFDTTGLLMTRGPYTFRGYYNSPQQNAQVFDDDGFYCSGDLVQRTADGYLRVVGRVKDQINRGGEKIAAEEIEHLLLQHEDIIAAALVAMPDALMGEKSCAFIVTTAPTLRPMVLRKYLRTLGIADYKLPDRFELIDRLPLTAVGKIDKRRLRQQLQSLPAETLPTTATSA